METEILAGIFCFIDNVVQANILAATTTNEAAVNQVYNVAAGDRISLMQLFSTFEAAPLRAPTSYVRF